MPGKKPGFFKKRYRTILPAKPFAGYNVSITPTLSNNDETVNFAITSELPANLNCNFVLLNTEDADWVGANASGSVQLDSTGNANVSVTLDPDVNFDYVSNNVNLIFQLNTTNGGQLGTSSNVTFARGNTFNATGGTESQISGSNIKLHSYTTTGTQGFNITSLGGDPANTVVRHLIVGGGGRGGDGYTYNNDSIAGLFDPIFSESLVFYGGGGGAGGVVTEGNATANTFSIANLSVVVGAGSNAMGTSGANSSFNSIVSVGGGSGSGATVSSSNANSVVFHTATAHTGGPGGGGVRQIADQYDFRGANGTFTGGTAAQTIAFPNASGNVLLTYFSIMSGAGASQNAQPSDPVRIHNPGANIDYSPANAAVGTTSDITGSNVTYGGGGGGGPVPEYGNVISDGHFVTVLNPIGLGVDGGGNGGHLANTAAPNNITVVNNEITEINGNASLLAQPGVDNRGGGGGGGTTAGRLNNRPLFGKSSLGGKGGDGVVFISYPFYIRRMQV